MRLPLWRGCGDEVFKGGKASLRILRRSEPCSAWGRSAEGEEGGMTLSIEEAKQKKRSFAANAERKSMSRATVPRTRSTASVRIFATRRGGVAGEVRAGGCLRPPQAQTYSDEEEGGMTLSIEEAKQKNAALRRARHGQEKTPRWRGLFTICCGPFRRSPGAVSAPLRCRRPARICPRSSRTPGVESCTLP